MNQILTIYISSWLLLSSVKCENKTVLNVGILLELTDNWYEPYTKGFIYIIQKVFDNIKSRHDLLQDYEFNLTVKDTKVSTKNKVSQGVSVLHYLACVY